MARLVLDFGIPGKDDNQGETETHCGFFKASIY